MVCGVDSYKRDNRVSGNLKRQEFEPPGICGYNFRGCISFRERKDPIGRFFRCFGANTYVGPNYGLGIGKKKLYAEVQAQRALELLNWVGGRGFF